MQQTTERLDLYIIDREIDFILTGIPFGYWRCWNSPKGWFRASFNDNCFIRSTGKKVNYVLTLHIVARGRPAELLLFG
jgi:hypothetical protein